MSFSSRSSKGNRYKKSNYGSGHYQKKGIFENILSMIGSRSGSDKRYKNQYQNNINTNQRNNHNTDNYNQNARNQTGLNCNRCSSNIPAGSKFCLECGESVNTAVFCMNCGETLPSNAKFCLKCGTKVSR
ncbi:MAG: zinc ribbon domain-containing protein [Clostridium sp.]